MKSRVTVGTVAKPQGIKGELKINPLTDDNMRFLDLKKVFVGGVEYAVAFARVSPAGVFVKLDGVNDRNAAELLRGKQLQVERKDAVKLPEGRYFIADVIGCDVLMDGKKIGTVKDVLQYSSTDIYEAALTRGGKVFFPAVKEAVEEIDVEKGVMIVNAQKFAEVALYEN